MKNYKINPCLKYISMWVMLFVMSSSFAQTSESLFSTLSEEDQKSIEALVLYPDSIRDAIFIASTQPEVLIRLDALTKYTREEFEDILSDFEQNEQEQLWEISRYPELVEKLSVSWILSKERIKELTVENNEKVQKAALNLGRNEHVSLSRMNDLNNSYDVAFKKLISSYNSDVKDAYWLLLNQPEILEILSDNIKLTILVGDNYKKDPEGIKQQSDSLQAVIAQRNAEELDAWKEELESNPGAKEELKKAADEYAKEQGYEDEYYVESRNRTVIVHHYPYWYGHPRWHPYHSWYPHNYYWDWGFHYDAFGNMIIVGLPSYHFSFWFFSNPFWYHHYSHFGHHCLWHHHHHYHHYNYYGYHGMHLAINHWHRDMGITDTGWLADRRNGPRRIKEMGKFETDRASYNKSNPQNPMTRDDYLQANKANYPEISKRPTSGLISKEKPKTEVRPDPIYVRPEKERTSKDPARKTIKSKPITRDRQYRAPEHHKNVWERSNRTSSQSRSGTKARGTTRSSPSKKIEGRRK